MKSVKVVFPFIALFLFTMGIPATSYFTSVEKNRSFLEMEKLENRYHRSLLEMLQDIRDEEKNVHVIRELDEIRAEITRLISDNDDAFTRVLSALGREVEKLQTEYVRSRGDNPDASKKRRMDKAAFFRLRNAAEKKWRELDLLMAKALKAENRMRRLYLIGFYVLSMCILIIFPSFLLKFYVKPIKHTLETLLIFSNQLSYASGEVSEINRQFSENASEQAAAIEEISASTEELNAMMGQNATDTEKAEQLTKENALLLKETADALIRLEQSIKEIDASSEQVKNIIRKIDEIAFQTNLLALNSAIEAARAGEAGAGFGVVSGEVKALAARASQAASDSTRLIEESRIKIDNCSEFMGKTAQTFQAAMDRNIRIQDLIERISVASNHQVKGIMEINSTLSEIEKTVTQIAIRAEESVSIVQILKNQAKEQKGITEDLSSRIGIQKATPEEVVKMVKNASEFLAGKKERGLQVFNEKHSPWAWKDTYVFVQDYVKGITVAHPMKNEIGTAYENKEDIRGKRFLAEASEKAKNSKGGWVEYWWPKPGKKKALRKVTYMVRVPGTPYQLGAGVYDDKLSIQELEKLLR